MVEKKPQLSASVGVHPGYKEAQEPTAKELIELAQHPRVVAIGETGLDYYRLEEPLDWQRERFERHLLRSEEHTSELQSRGHLVCRLLLEKKNERKTLTSTNPTLIQTAE